MLSQAAQVALRIVLFRAGPQDFPYAAALAQLIVPLTALTAFAQYRLTLPTPQAAVHAIASVAAIAGFTWVLMQGRGLLNRYQQTIHSLLLTDAMLSLVLLGPLAAIAPNMLRIAQNPELARTEPVPALPALAVMAVTLWNFMVSSSIYRHALNTNLGVGALVALLGAIVTVSIASAVSALVA